MSLEIALLHTLVRFSRRRSVTTLDELVERVGAEPQKIMAALRALARQGLVQRSPLGPRLTLAGLAVAVATKQQKPRAKRLPGIAMPLVRRRSAA